METKNSTLVQKLIRIQSSIGAVTKGSKNPHFKSKYADLNECLAVAKEALCKEELLLTQSPGRDTYGSFVETRVTDLDGTYLNAVVYFTGMEDNMQKVGAAITYARRFGLVSLLALESEDDDGETAVGRGYTNAQTQHTPTPTPAPKTTTLVRGTSPNERETLNKLIRTTAKVAVDKKLLNMDDVKKWMGVEKLEDLSDTDAKGVLNRLQEVLK